MVCHSSSHTGACLPRHEGRQPFTENIAIPAPALFRPAIDTSSPNEARRPTIEISTPLSPLGLTGISPVTHELDRVASTGFLGIVDQQTGTQAAHRRSGSDTPSSTSRSLPPVPEDPLDPDIQVLHSPAPSQSASYGGREPARSSTTPNHLAPSALSLDLRRIDSSSSRTSTASGSSKLRRLFGKKRSQTTSDDTLRISGDLSRPGTSSSTSSSLHPGPPSAKPPSPKRTWTSPDKKSPKVAAPQPTLSATLSIDLPQSRNWEPVNPVVLGLMEMAASDSECLLRPATDGTVSAGNLEGLVSRVITEIEDPSRNDRFRETFLTIYQLFATSERLMDILKRRFESSELDPVAARSRYS
jgi:RasGEF N-terminal motif